MKYSFISAEEAAASIHNGNTIGIGGFSSVGTPKAVPAALAVYAEKLHSEGKAAAYPCFEMLSNTGLRKT